MQFFYTGAQLFQAIQTDPNLSLGGYISNTIVPNNGANNIFSDISYQTAQQQRVEVKGLILKNTLGIDTTDVLFGYTYPANANFKVEVAFIQINPTNPQQIEKIPTSQSSPYFATFQEANIDTAHSINNSVDIGPILNNGNVGVWFRRTLTGIFTPPTFQDVPTEMAYWQALTNPSADSTQLTNLIIKYTVNQ